jgi:drug/metabolite transporter (DMT)-like permease
LTDAISKLLGEELHPIQVTWGRYAFHAAVLLPLFLRAGLGRVLATRRPLLHMGRGFLMMLSSAAFIVSLTALPLADAIAISFINPLLVAALSVILLSERLTSWGWLAVLGGFLGVLIVLRPTPSAFQLAGLWVVASAACWSFALVFTRMVREGDSVLTTQAYGALVGFLVVSLAAPAFWAQPSLAGWALMAAMGSLSGLGHFLLIRAFNRARASVLAPIAYGQLIWATIIGVVLFGDLPDLWTVVGTAVIVACGLMLLISERRAGPAPAPAPSAGLGPAAIAGEEADG